MHPLLKKILDPPLHFQNYWNLDLDCKHETAFQARKVFGTFEKQAPGILGLETTSKARCRTCSLSSWLNKDLTRFMQSLSRVPRQIRASERKAPLEGIQLIQEILLVHKLRTKKVKTGI